MTERQLEIDPKNEIKGTDPIESVPDKDRCLSMGAMLRNLLNRNEEMDAEIVNIIRENFWELL